MKLFRIIILTLVIITFSIVVLASNITSQSKVWLNQKAISSVAIDEKESTYITVSKANQIQINSDEQIQGLYVIYELESKR